MSVAYCVDRRWDPTPIHTCCGSRTSGRYGDADVVNGAARLANGRERLHNSNTSRGRTKKGAAAIIEQ